MNIKDINKLIDNTVKSEIKKAILNESSKEYYHVKADGEPIETFENKEDAEQYVMDMKDKKTGKELIIDKTKYKSYDEMLDSLDKLNDNLNKNTNKMKKRNKLSEDMYQYDTNEYDLSEFIDMSDESFEDAPESFEDAPESFEDAPESFEDAPESFEDSGKSNVDDEEFLSMVDDYKSHKQSMDEYSYEDDDDEYSPDTSFEDDIIAKSPKYEPKPSDEEQRFIDALRRAKNAELDGMKRGKTDDEESETLSDMTEGGYGQCDECGAMMNESGVCSECGSRTMEEMDSYDEYNEGMSDDFTHSMTDEATSEYDEEFDMVNENKKKKIRLKESELINLIKNIIKESVPGMTVTKKAQNTSNTDNKKHYKEVGSKMKKRESFEGNDNPEFPHQIGSKTKKVARTNTTQQDEEVSKNKAGLQNLQYDIEPSENFKKRMKMSIEGHSTMGNAPFTKSVKTKSTNAIKTDTPKKIKKQVEDRKKDKDNRVIYKKEKVPVKTQAKEEVNESKKPNAALLSEIQKINKLSKYNQKTQ